VISPPTCFKVLNPDDTQKRRSKEMFDKVRINGERVAAEIHPSFSV
jgi:hypothetical protein